MIALDKVDFAYGSKPVLERVSLVFPAAGTVCLFGPSGCGKTTILRLLAGLEVPAGGTVRGVDELRAAVVFQENRLLPWIPVWENVAMVHHGSDARERAMDCLERVGLADSAKAYPAQLSGGQKQRVAIARALASDPQILLCDEATSALDPQTTSSILELLQDINQKFGITIVIITHQMSVVREICTHVAIMKDGEVKEQGLVEEIFSHPKSQVAKELISKDSGNDVESKKLTQSEIQDGEIVRIVFSENSAFEPVIANLILTFHEPVNILKANTKNVGGVAKGEMILQFMSDSTNVPEMKKFLTERGLEIGEAN